MLANMRPLSIVVGVLLAMQPGALVYSTSEILSDSIASSTVISTMQLPLLKSSTTQITTTTNTTANTTTTRITESLPPSEGYSTKSDINSDLANSDSLAHSTAQSESEITDELSDDTIAQFQGTFLSVFDMLRRPESIDRSRITIPAAMKHIYAAMMGDGLDTSGKLLTPGPLAQLANTIRSFVHAGNTHIATNTNAYWDQ